MVRICRRAGLPERKWHVLRHTYATHSALFGVNPWILMQRLVHRGIEQTMRYVHVASHHRRELPPLPRRANAIPTVVSSPCWRRGERAVRGEAAFAEAARLTAVG